MPEGKPRSLASYRRSTEVGDLQISFSMTLSVAGFKSHLAKESRDLAFL